MKKILLIVLLIVPFYSIGQSWYGPDYIEDGHAEEIDTIQRPSQYAPFGLQFTPKGNFHGILICVNFSGKDGNIPVGNWVSDTLLLPHQQILSSIATTGTPLEYFYSNQSQFAQYYNDPSVKNISKFYQFMSKDSLRFTMDVYKRNGVPWAITIDPTGDTSWSQMNYKAINQILIEDSTFNWGVYDNRSNHPNYLSSNVLSAPDSIPDFIVFVYKYNNTIGTYWANESIAPSMLSAWPPGINGSGYASSAIASPPGFNFNGYRFDDCGFTFVKGGQSMNTMIIHEASHNIFSCPHYGSANRISGNYFFPENGWGTMNVGSGAFYCALGWERWWLDWIDIKSNNQTVNSHILGDSSLIPTNGEYILHDFVTTGDVVRVKIPFSETQTGRSQYLWLENHQGTSIFDDRGWERDGALNLFPSSPRGVVAYIEEIGDNKENPSIFSVGANGIKYLSPTGRYDISYDPASYSQSQNAWYNYIYNFYNFQNSNPIAGQFGTQGIMKDYNNSDTIIKGFNTNEGPVPYEEAHSIWKKNNSYTYDFIQHNINFPVSFKMGMASNPVLINYPKYLSSTHKVGNYYLNGLSFQVIEQYPNGSIKVKIRFKDVNINNNIRYCGNIFLPNITNDTGVDIIVDNSKVLTIDKSGTPNRVTKIDGDFVDFTTFTCTSNAKFLQEVYSTVDVINKSTLKLENASTYEVKSGATLNIKSNSHLIMQSGCTLLVRDNATVFIENGSDLQFNGGTITLEGTNSKLEIAGTLEIAANKTFTFNGSGYVKFSSPDSPSENVVAHSGSSIEFVGSGRTDLVVDISQESLYIPDSVVNFTVHNAMIYMNDNVSRLAVLWDCTFIDIENVKFSPQSANRTSHRGLQVFGQQNCIIDSCFFEKGKYGVYGFLTYFGAPLEITDSDFDDLEYGVWAHDKELRLINCSFTDCDYGTWAQNMSFTNSKIEDGGYLQNDYGVYYTGGTGANLLVYNTDIGWSTNYGLSSTGAYTTTVRCSDIYSNGTSGISIASSGVLNMSENLSPQGGRSQVFNNGTVNLSFFFANSPNLSNGYNKFSRSSGNMLVSGILNGGCNLKLAAIPATYNRWFYPTNNDPVNVTNYDLQVFGCNPVKRFTMTTSPLGDYETCGSGGGTLSIGSGEEEILVSEIEQAALVIALENEDYNLALDYYYNDLFSTGSLLSNNHSKDYDKTWEGIKYCFGQIRNQAPAMTNAGSCQVFNKVEMALNKMKQINANNPKRLFFLDLEHATLFRSVGDEIAAIQILNNMLTILTENDEIQETEYWLCIIQTEREIKLGNIPPQDIENYNNTCESIIKTKQQRVNDNFTLNSPLTNDIVLSVIPNPVTSQSEINVELFDKSSAIIEIIDTEGKVIKVFNLTEQKSTINVRSNDLPKKVYTVKVLTSGGLSKTTRMIIQ